MDVTDRPKILKRKITPEILRSRKEDMQAILDNYRENLHNRGVTDEAAIDQFIAGEQDKMEKEFDSLDNGDTSSNIYHEPMDWDSIASELRGHEVEDEDEDEMSM